MGTGRRALRATSSWWRCSSTEPNCQFTFKLKYLNRTQCEMTPGQLSQLGDNGQTELGVNLECEEQHVEVQQDVIVHLLGRGLGSVMA